MKLRSGLAMLVCCLWFALTCASLAVPVSIVGGILAVGSTVNFNSVADTALAINSSATNWQLKNLIISNCSGTIVTARFALFSGTGGTGTAIIAITVPTVITASANTAASIQTVAPTVAGFFNYTTVYFRVTTVQGSAVTCNVYLEILPLP